MLEPLGIAKLADLVVAESAHNPSFRRSVNAALAALKGPQAVAALIDRRLSALARARGFIDWDKARDFAADLDSTLQSISGELAAADPAMAAERLIAFVATSAQVFKRIDDSSGHIQGIYEEAIAKLGGMAAAMPEKARRLLPDIAMAKLSGDEHAETLWPDSHPTFRPMRSKPGIAVSRRSPLWLRKNAKERDWGLAASVSQFLAARQHIALALGDLDQIIKLEETREPRLRDHKTVATLLLKAGRHEEALHWIRQREKDGIAYMSRTMLADRADVIYPIFWNGVPLEAQILDALDRKDEAQALRWNAFEKNLNPAFLREHLQHADDFAEFEILDRAFAMVNGAPQVYAALEFYLKWPEPEKAADLIVRHRERWDGRHYDILAEAADMLERGFPAAATILYRALLNDILVNGKSKAYGHGARYLSRLDRLDAEIGSSAIPGLASHVNYRLELTRAHGRKTAFWAQAASPRRG